MSKVAIVGASGYSGEELLRLLMRHPGVELAAITSRQNVGLRVDAVFPRFAAWRDAALTFSDSTVEAIQAAGAEYVFLALPHGVAKQFAGPLVQAGLKVLDLSADFRIKDIAVYEAFYGEKHDSPELAAASIYGLPEIYRSQISGAQLIACPGCYPTSIILPLAPLLRAGLLEPSSIAVSSMSGVSGAGRTLKADYLFGECNESVRAYGIPRHRHLAEIEQELTLAAGGTQPVTISFTPHLIPVTRGIHSTIYAQLKSGVSPEAAVEALETAYAKEHFVRLLQEPLLPDTKHVVGTNFIDIAFRHDRRTGRVILCSAEDNLVKGAAGQAVQCFNIMAGHPETAGLE